MKILALSDLHSDIPKDLRNGFDFSEIDLICIAGDLTNFGLKEDYIYIFKWFDKLNIPTVIVLGNHDHPLFFYEINRKKYKNLIFLNNEIKEVNGLKIYGSPYTKYCGWFNHYLTLDECRELTLPKEKVDLIVSHEPPDTEMLAKVNDRLIVGNNELLKYLHEYSNITAIFGHVHQRGGKEEIINGNKCYNVARTYKIIEV